MSTTFAARLNRLFDTVYPPGRGPHTSAEVIAALKSEGITMSAPYLSQLRSGNRTNPSTATMAALGQLLPHQAGLLHRRRVLRKARQGIVVAVPRCVTTVCAASRWVPLELSTEAQQNIVDRVNELRRKEQLGA